MSTDESGRKQNGYQLGSLIRTSAHDIWLAGLGAYSRANKEGSRFFESLVELGAAVEKKARNQVARPFRAAERQMDGARSAVNETWERLEMLFDRRVARALHSLQIPTQRDVAELTRRVAKLQALVEELSQAPVTGRQASRPGVKKTGGRAGAGTRSARAAGKAKTRKKRASKTAGRARSKSGKSGRSARS